MAVSSSQIREAQIRLGLTLDELATFLGGTSARSARHWLDGDRQLSGAAEILLRLVLGMDLRHANRDDRDRVMAVAKQVRLRNGRGEPEGKHQPSRSRC